MTNPSSPTPPVVIQLKQSHAWIIGSLVAVAIAVLAYATWHNDQQMNQWRNNYNAYRDTVAAVLKKDSALVIQAQTEHNNALVANAKADSLTKKINAANVATAKLHATNDSLVKRALSDTTLSPIARQAIDSLVSENDSLRNTIALDAQRDTQRLAAIAKFQNEAALQKKRGDDFEVELHKLPGAPPQEKLFGLIPLPSKEATFFIGVGLGLLASHYTSK